MAEPHSTVKTTGKTYNYKDMYMWPAYPCISCYK